MRAAAIIGSDSMLGRAITVQLRQRGIAVLSVGRASHHDLVMDLCKPLSQDLAVGLKVDVVFHCAAAFAGEDLSGIRHNLTTNAVGCVNVLALMEQLECAACIYAGTIFSIPDTDSAGLSSYGLSKAQAEQILAWGLARKGRKFCSIRLSQIYDVEGLCCAHQPWFGRIIAYASSGMDLRLPPSSGSRNFVHVNDSARLMIAAAEHGLTGCWPLCHFEELDNTQIAEIAYREFDNGGRIIIDMSKAPFRPFTFPRDRTLYDILQDEPRIKMADGIAMIHQSSQAVNFGPVDVQ